MKKKIPYIENQGDEIIYLCDPVKNINCDGQGDRCYVVGGDCMCTTDKAYAPDHDKRPLYLCDPRKNRRCNKTSCYIYGGPCKYTSKKRFRA